MRNHDIPGVLNYGDVALCSHVDEYEAEENRDFYGGMFVQYLGKMYWMDNEIEKSFTSYDFNRIGDGKSEVNQLCNLINSKCYKQNDAWSRTQRSRSHRKHRRIRGGVRPW